MKRVVKGKKTKSKGKPSADCLKRLTREYKKIQADPPPFTLTRPAADSLLEWHFVFKDLIDCSYANGTYWGKLVFPPDYPHKPPSIFFMTPNGRFETNKSLCFSMSSFHPELWQPVWTVSSILTGLLSFMLDEAQTYGSIRASHSDRVLLAKKSLHFNLLQPRFRVLFPELVNAEQSEGEGGENGGGGGEGDGEGEGGDGGDRLHEERGKGSEKEEKKKKGGKKEKEKESKEASQSLLVQCWSVVTGVVAVVFAVSIPLFLAKKL